MVEYDIELVEEAPPDPAATIETLGALGYTTESAVADLIDNSITAGATRVDVTLHWDGANSWCAVADNGRGMTGDELTQAMTIGSRDPVLPRDTADLGRFGFGLKTASFSQCRELTVGSRVGGLRFAYRTWDLDYVRSKERWLLVKSPPPIAQELIEMCHRSSQGTVVLWRRLNRNLVEEGVDVADEHAHQRFLQVVQSLERHLAMTFGRFLLREHDPLQIHLNGSEVYGWDPFFTDHPATRLLPPEPLSLRGEKMEVLPYVLPHRSKLSLREYERTGGPRGWNAQQGFYVYRSDRLIQAGGWFTRGHSQGADYNLARISVHVPATLDRDWSLDVKKAFVRPPGPLASDLSRVARVAREEARKVYRHRGAQVGRRTHQPAEPVWNEFRRHGKSTFRINRKHPLIAELLEDAGSGRKAVLDIIRVIEETLPIPFLTGQQTKQAQVPLDTAADEDITRIAERVYDNLLRKGLTRQAARDRLLKIEPFDLYPNLVDQIFGGG